MGQLRHPHLVKLIGYCCEDEHRMLVYEYMPGGSLENQLFKSMFIFSLIKIYFFFPSKYCRPLNSCSNIPISDRNRICMLQ